MTITYLGLGTERSANNTQGKRAYMFTLLFETSDEDTEREYQVGSMPQVPAIGAAHPDDPYCWLQSIDVNLTEPKYGWTVTLNYSSERELATDPTSDPAIITVNTEQFQKVADRDKDGNAICNSAGDPFDPPYMMDDSRRVIQIQKNMSGHPSWVLNYADVVNSDSFIVNGVTYTAGQGKVQRVTIGEQQVRNGVPFVTVSLEIHLQRDGWILRPLDAGFRQLAYDGTTRINIYNPAATPSETGDLERVTAPVPLDGFGKAQVNPTTASGVYGAFTVYTTAVFSVLPLT